MELVLAALVAAVVPAMTVGLAHRRAMRTLDLVQRQTNATLDELRAEVAALRELQALDALTDAAELTPPTPLKRPPKS